MSYQTSFCRCNCNGGGWRYKLYDPDGYLVLNSGPKFSSEAAAGLAARIRLGC